MLPAFQAALLGVIQGLTEFLPVSSTAHLLIAQKLRGYEDPAFTTMIQLGSVLAVMWLYRTKLMGVIRGLPGDPDALRFTLMILLAFIPAVIGGLLVADFVQTVLYESLPVIASAFIIGGIVMLLVEKHRPEPVVMDAERTPLARAMGIGVCQLLALVPGVSRSGATIVGGMVLGLDRAAAAEFSFFLAMPTMVAAFVYSLLDVGLTIPPDRVLELTVGFVMAFVSALLVVKPFLEFVRRAGFVPFAWYRIAFGVVLLTGVVAAGWQ
jgi:undecaprenyl-diphosphatase